MANVVITANLRERINSAVALKAALITKVVEDTKPDLGKRIYDRAFADIINGMLALPKFCFGTTDNITLDTNMGKIQFALPAPMPFPYAQADFPTHTWVAWSKTICKLEPTHWSDILNELAIWHMRKKEAEEKATTFKHSVDNIIKAHRSLNQAIKFWPPLREYIPGDALDRLEAVTTRAVAEPVKLDAIDLDTLSATAVRLKLSL
jgi:hypothetical protein